MVYKTNENQLRLYKHLEAINKAVTRFFNFLIKHFHYQVIVKLIFLKVQYEKCCNIVFIFVNFFLKAQ